MSPGFCGAKTVEFRSTGQAIPPADTCRTADKAEIPDYNGYQPKIIPIDKPWVVKTTQERFDPLQITGDGDKPIVFGGAEGRPACKKSGPGFRTQRDSEIRLAS